MVYAVYMDNIEEHNAKLYKTGDFSVTLNAELWRTRKNAGRAYIRSPRTVDRWRRQGLVRVGRIYRDGYPWVVMHDGDLKSADDAARASARGSALNIFRG